MCMYSLPLFLRLFCVLLSLLLVDVLKHIATFTSPEELMSLLPPNGNVMFFLPVIELSCKLYLAGNIANSLHSTLTGTLTQ